MGSNNFMSGEWTDLVMATFEIEAEVLMPYLPVGTELDLFNKKALFSMVAFTFSKVKFFGIPVPFHQNFGEINFRFYVRSKKNGRKGVVFLKEYAPKKLIAMVAKKIYNEPFFFKNIKKMKNLNEKKCFTNYKYPGGEIHAEASLKFKKLTKNTIDEFIIDRYVAFVKSHSQKTYHYLIKHKPWRFSKTASINLNGNILGMLPKPFGKAKLIKTHFVDGSEISVEKGVLEQEYSNLAVI